MKKYTKLKMYKIYDEMSDYIYGCGIYVNGINFHEMTLYFYVMDDFGNLIEID